MLWWECKWSLSCIEAFKDQSKKKSFLYKERQEERRQEFIRSLENIPPDKLVWVDECGVEEEVERSHGRAEVGRRVYGDISGNRKHHRTSVIAAYNQKKLKAPFCFKGYTNTSVFEVWVERLLVPLLIAGQIIILDNAAFHKSSKVRDSIEAVGAKVMFLPPYSPDINKIEPQWAVLKARLKKDKHKYSEFSQNLDAQLKEM